MDYKLLALALVCILLAYNAAAELTGDDYRVLQANGIRLEDLILKQAGESRIKPKKGPEDKGKDPNPGPDPDPDLKLKGKKVITIEEYEAKPAEGRSEDRPDRPEGDYSALKANGISLEDLILKQAAESRIKPTTVSEDKGRDPNPGPGPDPDLQLKGKQVITIEDYEAKPAEGRPEE